jgi:hypothetical protein
VIKELPRSTLPWSFWLRPLAHSAKSSQVTSRLQPTRQRNLSLTPLATLPSATGQSSRSTTTRNGYLALRRRRAHPLKAHAESAGKIRHHRSRQGITRAYLV